MFIATRRRKITLDGEFTVDQFAHSQHFVVGQLVHPPLRRDPNPGANLHRRCPADAVDVGQPNRYPLLIRDIDASDARHVRFSSKKPKIGVGPALRKGEEYTEHFSHVNPAVVGGSARQQLGRRTSWFNYGFELPRHLVDLGHAVHHA